RVFLALLWVTFGFLVSGCFLGRPPNFPFCRCFSKNFSFRSLSFSSLAFTIYSPLSSNLDLSSSDILLQSIPTNNPSLFLGIRLSVHCLQSILIYIPISSLVKYITPVKKSSAYRENDGASFI